MSALLIRILFIASLLIPNLLVRADSVDDYVRAAMVSGRIPGLALAVDRHGATIKTAGYGLANMEWKTPVTPQTEFQIQSVTKQFTATAIMMLAEAGKLSVDDKVSKYLEGAPDLWKDITLRHLLTHTSGIKDFINEPTASLRLDVTEEEVFKATAPRPLNFQPGEKYSYSNSNYHLLAMIIRKLTGMSYGEYLAKNIFGPLGMVRTRIVSLSDIIPNRAAGYVMENGQWRNGEYVAESILSYGGGGIVSTAPDMTKWDLALRGERLLKRSSLDQMWTFFQLNNGKPGGYGFGWAVGGSAPHRFVEHSGAHMTGFTSYILRFLDDDLSIIVLDNANFAHPGKIAHTIAGIYIPELKAPERKSIPDPEPSIAALLRRVEQMLRSGRVEEGLFTAEMRPPLISSASEMSEVLKAAGRLQRMDLLERNEKNGQRHLQYRLRFANLARIADLSIDQDGKISGLEFRDE